MTIYEIHFVDHGGRSFAVHEIDCPDDGGAIEEARTLDLRFIAMGFDLWDGGRLVHQERH